jgi:hypothetical protein
MLRVMQKKLGTRLSSFRRRYAEFSIAAALPRRRARLSVALVRR